MTNSSGNASSNATFTRWGTIFLSVLVLFVYGYFLLNSLKQDQNTSTIISIIVLGLTIVLDMVGLILTLRHKQENGLQLVITSLFVLGIYVATAFSGRVLTSSFSIFTVTLIAIEWLLPGRLHRRYFTIISLVIIFMWTMEWLDPSWRIPLAAVKIGPFATGIFAIALGAVIFRRSQKAILHSLRNKLLLPFIGTLILLTTLFIFFDYYTTNQASETESTRDLARIESAIQGQINQLEKLALALATNTANDPEVQAAFASGNREELARITLPLFETLQTEFDVKQYHFILPPATSFLRLHQLDKYGDDLTSFRATVVKANSDQTAISGLEIGRGGLGVRGVVPIQYRGKHIGVIDVGIDIGTSFIEEIKSQYGVDVQIMLEKGASETATFQGAVSDIAGPTDKLVFQAGTNPTPFFAEGSIYKQVLDGQPVTSTKNFDGQNFLLMSFPLVDYSGKSIGVIEIILNRSETIAATNAQFLNTILIALFIILLIIIAFIQFLNATIRPITELTQSAESIAEGNFNVTASTKSADEIGLLANAFNKMTSQLRDLFTTMERRIADRTQNLELAAEVGRSVSQVRALDVMLTEAAELIRRQFDLYYVQVYLTNPDETALNLQAGTGQIGTDLLKQGHHLPLTTASINGRAAIEKKSVIIPDTAASTTFLPNPLLSKTRSEMAVPLLFSEKVIGVLDMQSEIPNSLTQELLPAFQALAGQLVVAIQNATFFTETQEARKELEAQARQTQVALAQVEEQSRQTQIALLQAEAQAHLTQKLSDTGLLFTRATSLQEVIQIAITALEAPQVNRAILEVFNYNSENEVIGSEVIGNWWSGSGIKPTPIGYRYTPEELPLLKGMFLTPIPIFMEDARLDPRIDDLSMKVVENLNIRTVAGLPLFTTDRQIGMLFLESEQVQPFSEGEMQLLFAMTPQISTAVENRRQFERTRQQAKREATLNLISQKIQNATTVEAVLQIAAKEIGHALGTSTTVAQISMKDKK